MVGGHLQNSAPSDARSFSALPSYSHFLAISIFSNKHISPYVSAKKESMLG
jgi:hypothetical protein